jgi:hypothetical protein
LSYNGDRTQSTPFTIISYYCLNQYCEAAASLVLRETLAAASQYWSVGAQLPVQLRGQALPLYDSQKWDL